MHRSVPSTLRPKYPMKQILAAALALVALHATAAPSPVPADDPRLQPAAVTRIEPSASAGYPSIYIDGYIHKHTVEAFKRLGTLNGAGMGMVYFNSLGGDLVASVELGQLIRSRGFSTRVGRKGSSGTALPGRCESGCPLAFAGGKFRFLERESRMGVHQFYRASGQQPNDLSLAQVASALIAKHLDEMGVSLSLMEKMASADSSSMRYLSPLEAYDLGLVNAGALPSQWGVREVAGALVLLGEQETVQGTARIALACGERDTVQLAALFKDRSNVANLPSFNRVALELDGETAGLQESPVQIRNGFLSITSIPTDAQLEALTRAGAIGVRLSRVGDPKRLDFHVESREATPLIRSFIGLCKGVRPSLSDSL